MTDIKEAQGLEVVAYQWLDTAHYRKKLPFEAVSPQWFPLCSLPKAQAVIDQLREQVEYTEGMYATALEIVNELRADLETANSMLVATSKAGIQLRAANGDLQLHFDTLKADYAALKSAPVVMPERIIFPTILRKMWSGGEVQEWLDEYVARLNRSKT